MAAVSVKRSAVTTVPPPAVVRTVTRVDAPLTAARTCAPRQEGLPGHVERPLQDDDLVEVAQERHLIGAEQPTLGELGQRPTDLLDRLRPLEVDVVEALPYLREFHSRAE